MQIFFRSKIFSALILFFIFNTLYAADSYYYPRVTSSVDPNVTTRETFLQNRDNAFYASIAGQTSAQVMTMLSPGGDGLNGPNGLNDNNLGGVDPKSADAIQRQGAAQLVELALFHGLPTYLNDAVAKLQEDVGIRIMQFRLWVAENPKTNTPNGDVKQRQERGGIAYEAWLLNQAHAYFTSRPGQAVPVRPTSLADLNGATIQGMVEAFTADYVEELSPGTTWPTTGYNKEVAQGLHPAYMIGIYSEPVYASLYPNSYKGFFIFWNGMLAGQQGSYDVENTPSYGNFNVSMVMNMGLALNRLVRPAGSTDPHAFISDSVDMPRLLDRFVSETMTNGNAVNYNKAISNYNSGYAYNNPENTGPFNLKIGYSIFGNPNYLYTARKLEMFMLTTGTLSNTRLDATELYPLNIQHYDVLNVPAPTATPTVTQMRISPSCYNGLLLCRAAPQSKTALIPNKMLLITGQTDNAPYVLLSIAGAGQHANLDQRMTLENTSFNGAYTAARAGRPCQVNQSNSALVVPTTLAFPVFEKVVGDCEDGAPTDFYQKMGLNSATNNYILESATASQNNGDGSLGQISYSQYEYPGYHAVRQVILKPNGMIFVKDSIWNDGTAKVVANGGVTWRLWPGVAASGTNWALQSPRSAITAAAKLPGTSDVSTLFYFSNASGRTFGNDVEPLSDLISGGVAGNTLTTYFNYDSLADNKVHSFVSLIIPLLNTGAAASIASKITVTTNANGATTVTVPDSSGSFTGNFAPITSNR